MKKLLSFMICFCFVLASAFTFVACGNEKVSIDDTMDRIEETSAPAGSFMTLLSSQQWNEQQEPIVEATSSYMRMLSGINTFLTMLDLFNDGEYSNDLHDMGVITKDGNTYTFTDGEDITKVVVKSGKDTLTLTVDETSTLKYTLAKNYLRIDASETSEGETFQAWAELKVNKNNHYYQLVMKEDETYNVINFKYNFTLTEVGDAEYATINSFSTIAKTGETTEPSSIKGLKDYETYATGEGAVTYTSPTVQ